MLCEVTEHQHVFVEYDSVSIAYTEDRLTRLQDVAILSQLRSPQLAELHNVIALMVLADGLPRPSPLLPSVYSEHESILQSCQAEVETLKEDIQTSSAGNQCCRAVVESHDRDERAVKQIKNKNKKIKVKTK